MIDNQLETKISSLLQPILDNHGVDLIDISIRHKRSTLDIKIIADKPVGGITIDECTFINKDLTSKIEEDDVIGIAYIIEVNSPGLDRLLKSNMDFKRVLGRDVQFHLAEKVESKLEYSGKVKNVDRDHVTIQTKTNLINIPLNNITKAIQVI